MTKYKKKKNKQLQVDNEFLQIKIKYLNDKYNVTMFTTSIRGGKAFATEQKIREFKSSIAKLEVIFGKYNAKIPPTTLIRQLTENMRNVKSEKYGISHDDIEKRSLSSERFKILFNFKRIERSKKFSDRLDRYDQTKYAGKKRKLHENLNIGEKVFVLAERINKKRAPDKFYKQTVQNIFYFNKKTVFQIRNKNEIDKKTYYWLKNTKTNQYLPRRFQRNEIISIVNNFVM